MREAGFPAPNICDVVIFLSFLGYFAASWLLPWRCCASLNNTATRWLSLNKRGDRLKSCAFGLSLIAGSIRVLACQLIFCSAQLLKSSPLFPNEKDEGPRVSEGWFRKIAGALRRKHELVFCDQDLEISKVSHEAYLHQSAFLVKVFLKIQTLCCYHLFLTSQ